MEDLGWSLQHQTHQRLRWLLDGSMNPQHSVKKHGLNFPWFSPLGLWSFQAWWFLRGNQKFSFTNPKMKWDKKGCGDHVRLTPCVPAASSLGLISTTLFAGWRPSHPAANLSFLLCLVQLDLFLSSFLWWLKTYSLLPTPEPRPWPKLCFAETINLTVSCWIFCNLIVTIKFRRKVVHLLKINLRTECLCLSVVTNQKAERIFPYKCKHNWMSMRLPRQTKLVLLEGISF